MQICLDIDVKGHYDQSNELVLPSKKRKTKVKKENEKVTRILSKKQRKKYEKILEKKQKQEGVSMTTINIAMKCKFYLVMTIVKISEISFVQSIRRSKN